MTASESAYTEQVLLGRMLESDSADFVDLAAGALSPAAFHSAAHRSVFTAISALHAGGMPVDLVSVAGELTNRGQLQEIGGAAALSQLTDASLSASAKAPDMYLAMLADSERMRVATQGLESLMNQIRDGNIRGVDELQAKVEAMFDSPSYHSTVLPDIGTQMRSFFTELEDRLKDDGQLRGVPSGWNDLDGTARKQDSMALIKGWKPGRLIVVAARPGSGKSTALVDWVRAACRAGKGVVLFTLEMTEAELVELIVVAECENVHREKLQDPKTLSDTQWDKVSEAMARVASWPLIIDDQTRTLPQMRRVAAAARAKFRNDGFDLDVIFEDYVQLTDSPPGMRPESRSIEVGTFTKGFKAMAKDLGIPVVVAAQFNRGPADGSRKPVASDLKESGSIEEDADLVLALHRPFAVEGGDSGHTPDDLQVLILKNRHGPTGVQFSRSFLGEFSRTSEPLPRSLAHATEPPR